MRVGLDVDYLEYIGAQVRITLADSFIFVIRILVETLIPQPRRDDDVLSAATTL